MADITKLIEQLEAAGVDVTMQHSELAAWNIFDTIDSWADDLCMEVYDEGYLEGEEYGYSSGFDDGRYEGHDVGYDVGFEEGREDGYEAGYDEGRTA